MDIKQFNKRVEQILIFLLSFLKTIFILFFGMLMLSGTTASLIILYKMYPEIGLELIEKIFIFSGAFMFLIRLGFVSLVVCFLISIVIAINNNIESAKKKRQAKKEEFLDELVIKLKKRNVIIKETKPKK